MNNSHLKILQINVFNYRKGGSEAVYFNTIELLKEKGHNVINFALQWPENYISTQSAYFPESKETRKGVFKNINNLINYFYNFKAATKIEKLIRDEKPEIAHIHLIWGQITPSILPVLKKYHIPIVFSIHDYRIVCPAYTCKNGKGFICEKCGKNSFYYCVINKCAKGNYLLSTIMASEQYFRNALFNPSKYIDGLLYVSKFAKSIHEKYMPSLKMKKNLVLYNVINKINELPSYINNDKYYLYFGRLSYEKGIKTLIEAFKELPQCVLKIAGTGPLNEELQEYKKKYKINNIEFLGYKSGEELSNLIQNAHFVVVPSEWYENNPMTIIEAYAVGTPVIGASIGGIPEIISENKTGFLFKSGNLHELTKCIEKADNLHEQEYSRYSASAIEFAKKNFNRDSYYYTLWKFYMDLITK